jgi:hypothetical protein
LAQESTGNMYLRNVCHSRLGLAGSFLLLDRKSLLVTQGELLLNIQGFFLRLIPGSFLGFSGHLPHFNNRQFSWHFRYFYLGELAVCRIKNNCDFNMVKLYKQAMVCNKRALTRILIVPAYQGEMMCESCDKKNYKLK